MLDVTQRPQKTPHSSLTSWVTRAIGIQGMRLRSRIRGNTLHLFCESSPSPDVTIVVPKLLRALKARQFPDDSEQPIYQIVLYGGTPEQHRPEWVEAIDLNQIEEHLKQWQISSDSDSATPGGALLVSNQTLASSGSPEAIARYISEILSPLGVSVRVFIQNLPLNDQLPETKERRLWIICDADYSPDPSLLVKTVAQPLRDLLLEGFRDAVVRFSVCGEPQPDWLLKIDLTPPEEMLRDWARWGDVEAITQLLNQGLNPEEILVRAVLKEATLHLFCSSLPKTLQKATIPSQEIVVSAIAPLLESLGPQGIQGATVYGVDSRSSVPLPKQESPAWVEWLNLPASIHPALAPTPLELAQQGDIEALTFLLQRLLNPNLDLRLSTGGIALSLRRKNDLLHIMSEAPICPRQRQVGLKIAHFLRPMTIPGVAGIRVYGRRAGQSAPIWQYGVDFVKRRYLVSEPTPEFAPANVWSGNDINLTTETSLEQPATTAPAPRQTTERFWEKLQRWLCNSRLCVPIKETKDEASLSSSPSRENYSSTQGVKTALVWGSLGLALTLQADWLTGYSLRVSSGSSSIFASNPTPTPEASEPEMPILSLQKSKWETDSEFNSSGFTSSDESSNSEDNTTTSASPSRGLSAAVLAAARATPNPSFNNTLLDEKLLIYQQLCATEGPPDILIVGSSRAMRGVDPVALRTALAAQGYPDLKIFNFGINGATAKTVDLLLRRVLTPEQLPKLIIWADGARAFNSGRTDITYNAIAQSKGYQQLEAGTWGNSSTANRTGNRSLTKSVQSIDELLSEALGQISPTYQQREPLKAFLVDRYRRIIPHNSDLRVVAEENLSPEMQMDIDGFLPISIRFEPNSYYQNFSKVTGDYDADYEAFSLDGDQQTAMNALVEFLQPYQVPLVFVNVPLTDDYLDSTRTKHEQEFQKYMKQVETQYQVVFRDLAGLWTTRYENFSDPSHLNRYGGEAVSKHLAQDSSIPWKR